MQFSDLANSPIPEAIMIAGGLIGLYIAILYLKGKDSQKYKVLAFVGMIVGILMLVSGIMAFQESTLSAFSISVLLLTGFALFFRPIQKIPIAVVIAVVVGVFVYLYVGGITDPNLQFLVQDTARIIVSIVAGAAVFMLFNFVEQLLDFASTVLNSWPVLIILGLVCAADGLMLIVTGDSILVFITSYTGG